MVNISGEEDTPLEKLIPTRRGDIHRIAAQHGIYYVRDFGSGTCKDVNAQNDIDLLISKTCPFDLSIFDQIDDWKTEI